MSDSMWPHGLQHARLPCPLPTPGACSNSCPLSRWCHPTISSSVVHFSSCLWSFPASRPFPMSQLIASGGQRIGASASESVLPMNNQDWLYMSPEIKNASNTWCLELTWKICAPDKRHPRSYPSRIDGVCLGPPSPAQPLHNEVYNEPWNFMTKQQFGFQCLEFCSFGGCPLREDSWIARRTNQAILKEISPEYSL